MSRSLNHDDRDRLVEAILRIDGMRVRRVRDLHLAALERELGHRVVFERYDQDKLDVWSLVDVLLGYPGAAQLLMEILKRFYGESISVQVLAELVRELLPEPWLGHRERHDLHQLITSLERADPDSSLLALFPMLYRRLVGPAWPRLDRKVRNLHEAVALMEGMPAGRDRVPPLLVFVAALAEHADPREAHALREWTRREAVAQRVGRALAKRQRAEVQARDGADAEQVETYLIIACTPDQLEPDRYLVTAWLQVNREPGTTLCCDDEAVSLGRIPELLEELLTADGSVIGRPTPELTIEFVLPRALLNRPVEQFKTRTMGIEYRIGIRHPVVVRSLDRMRNAASHHPWKDKWDRLCQNSVDAPFCLVERRGEYGDEEVLLAKLEASPAVLALAFPPSVTGEKPDEHWVGLVAGTPVIVWCRDGRDPARFAREVEDLLAEDLKRLPRRAMELRRRAVSAKGAGQAGPDPAPEVNSDHLGLQLTLLFDDADRIPEPYMPLRFPA